MMMRLASNSVIDGFKVGGDIGTGISVSHLLFANDTFILCRAEVNQFWSLHYLLLCSKVVSGLKVNLAKSEVIPIGRVGNVQELATILGCRVSSLPMTYLGLPLDARYKSIHICDDILERMERRLAGWKRMYFSKDGRITLIKSVLSSFPICFLSLFPIPIVVKGWRNCNEYFLWVNDAYKFHLLKWENVCSPIESGGLGLRKLSFFNKSFVG